MRRRQICEARVWTSAVPLSCVASTRPGRCERELDRASHAEAGPPRTDGLAALLPDRHPSARLGHLYEHRGSCLAATSKRPRAGRSAAFKRPDERRLSCASRVARLGGVIQKRTAAARVSFEPRHPSDPWTLRSYDRGSGRSIQLGGSPTAGAARAANLASATSRNGFGFAGHTVPTGGAPLTRYASMYSLVHWLRPYADLALSSPACLARRAD